MKADDLVAMIILLGVLPLAIIVIIFLINRAKHKERMAIIEKAPDISLQEQKDSPFHDVLFWGMLACGVGLGLLIGYILFETNLFKDDIIQGILAILFGGIALISYYFIKKRK